MSVRGRLSLVLASLALCGPPAVAPARPMNHLTPQLHGAGRGQKTIEIEDYSFDVEQVLDIPSRSKEARAGKVSFNPFQVTRTPDQASPWLLQSAATGEAFQTIILNTKRHGRRAKVVLHDVTVSGYRRSGGTERFTLRPAYGEFVG